MDTHGTDAFDVAELVPGFAPPRQQDAAPADPARPPVGTD